MDAQKLRDIRMDSALEVEKQARSDGPRPTCEECGERLPRGVHRRFCVVHSPYVQQVVHELMRRERRGRAPAPARRVA